MGSSVLGGTVKLAGTVDHNSADGTVPARVVLLEAMQNGFGPGAIGIGGEFKDGSEAISSATARGAVQIALPVQCQAAPKSGTVAIFVRETVQNLVFCFAPRMGRKREGDRQASRRLAVASFITGPS